MSFRSATVCLWAAALRVGALMGYFPVHWHGGRARAFSLARSLAASGSVLLLNITAIVMVKSVIGSDRFAFYTVYMITEAIINCTHRHEVALLLRCLWEYISVHPPRAARWRAMFLGTAAMTVWCAARFAFWTIYCCIELTISDVPGIVPFVLCGTVRCAIEFCVYTRLLCPLLVLGAVAADLLVECTQKVQEASQRRRPLHSEYWRALRQRQHLIHDMLREFSNANGFFLLMMMAYEFLAVTPTLGAGIATVDYMKKGGVLVLSTNIIFLTVTVAALSMCQWPAFEVNNWKTTPFNKIMKKKETRHKSATLT